MAFFQSASLKRDELDRDDDDFFNPTMNVADIKCEKIKTMSFKLDQGYHNLKNFGMLGEGLTKGTIFSSVALLGVNLIKTDTLSKNTV